MNYFNFFRTTENGSKKNSAENALLTLLCVLFVVILAFLIVDSKIQARELNAQSAYLDQILSSPDFSAQYAGAVELEAACNTKLSELERLTTAATGSDSKYFGTKLLDTLNEALGSLSRIRVISTTGSGEIYVEAVVSTLAEVSNVEEKLRKHEEFSDVFVSIIDIKENEETKKREVIFSCSLSIPQPDENGEEAENE